jgi:hypothetical protein
MVCGNFGEVSVRLHEVEGEFSLWKEFVPVHFAELERFWSGGSR